jgi:hypothetical protein
LRHLKNISVAKWEAFLELVGCHCNTSKTGHHEKWSRPDLNRPVIFQKTIDPIPEFIIKNNLRVLGYSKDDFFDILEFKKEVVRNNNAFEIRPIR